MYCSQRPCESTLVPTSYVLRDADLSPLACLAGGLARSGAKVWPVAADRRVEVSGVRISWASLWAWHGIL